MFTAAPGKASGADAHVAAALRVLAQAPVLQGSTQKSGENTLALPRRHRALPQLVAAAKGSQVAYVLWRYLARPVPTSRAVGDAVCREVEVMEHNLLTLDAQLPDAA